MRLALRLAALLLSACGLLPLRAVAAGPPPAPIEITAQNVALYADRRVLVADAGVAVKTGTRTFGASHAIVYLNEGRAVFSGGVTLEDGTTKQTGAAYALDIETGIGHFIDAVSTNDSGGTTPVVTSQRVVIRPNESLTFTPATVGNDSAVQTVASYTYPLAAPHARDFGPSPAIGAALQYPFLLGRGRNGYVFGTGRYDRYLGGLGAGIEGHFATSERGYAALAATQDGDGARYDLQAFQSIQDGLNQTLSASRGIGLEYARYALTSFGRTGTLQGSIAQNGATQADDLFASTNRHALGGGFALRLDGDLGRDLHPTDYAIAEDGRASAGAILDGPTLHFAGVSLSAQATAGGTAYNYGRRAFDRGVSTFASRSFGSLLLLSGSAAIAQINDQVGVYPRATYRTYVAAGTFTPRAPWSIFSSVQYANDFPQYAGFGRPEFLQTIALRIHRKRGPGLEIDTSFAYGQRGFMPKPTLSLSLLR
jgi:hypothetical protein